MLRRLQGICRSVCGVDTFGSVLILLRTDYRLYHASSARPDCLSLFCLLCDMAQEAWQRCMDDVGLPTVVAKLLISKGYVSKASFAKAFRTDESLETFIEAVLTRSQPCWSISCWRLGDTPCGWDAARALESKDASHNMQLALPQKFDASSGGVAPRLAAALLSWPGCLGSKVSADEISNLWSKFEKDYPSEVLEVQHRPCKQLIS